MNKQDLKTKFMTAFELPEQEKVWNYIESLLSQQRSELIEEVKKGLKKMKKTYPQLNTWNTVFEDFLSTLSSVPVEGGKDIV